jgi:hypothetical protein
MIMRARLLILAGVFALGAAVATGQAQRAPSTLDDVVNEIRGLRADLKKSTAATTQVQLLTVRLQLQEQRHAVLSNPRTDVMARLAIEIKLRADADAQVRRFEELKTRNEDLGVPRAEIEGAATASRRELTLHRDAEQQLRAQESQLSTDIANEQNRWQDFNNRLDELERSLK